MVIVAMVVRNMHQVKLVAELATNIKAVRAKCIQSLITIFHG